MSTYSHLQSKNKTFMKNEKVVKRGANRSPDYSMHFSTRDFVPFIISYN